MHLKLHKNILTSVSFMYYIVYGLQIKYKSTKFPSLLLEIKSNYSTRSKCGKTYIHAMYIQLAARPITCILAPLNTLWLLLCLEMKEMCEFDII